MNVDIYKIIYESNWYDNNGIPVRFVSDNIQFWDSNGEVTIDGKFVLEILTIVLIYMLLLLKDIIYQKNTIFILNLQLTMMITT